MRIAVLSDIHGNLPALECILEDIERWAPDHVIVNGDVVNRGPRPLACWKLICERMAGAGWQVLKGNHEEYVAMHHQPESLGEVEEKIHRGSLWTARLLGRENVDLLAALPDIARVDAGLGGEARFVHASMRDNRDGIYPDTDDETLRAQIAPTPRLFATAHTHRPLLRWWRETLVVNSGSVGLPFDRERQAAYARLTYRRNGWSAQIVRRDYDWQRAWDDYVTSGFLAEGGPLARLHRIELRDAVSHIHLWTPIYLEAVLERTLTLEAAVDAYFDTHVNVSW